MFSDSHALATLGKNAQGAKRLTRVKMDTPSFQALRIALQDADARIRLEDEIPESVPYIMGIKLDGNFLDGQTLSGATDRPPRCGCPYSIFECVRTIAPGDSDSNLPDCEIWPDVLSVVWINEAGQQQIVERRIQDSSVNVGDPDWGPTRFSIESYGQGETAQTSTRARNDPALIARISRQVHTNSTA